MKQIMMALDVFWKLQGLNPLSMIPSNCWGEDWVSFCRASFKSSFLIIKTKFLNFNPISRTSATVYQLPLNLESCLKISGKWNQFNSNSARIYENSSFFSSNTINLDQGWWHCCTFVSCIICAPNSLLRSMKYVARKFFYSNDSVSKTSGNLIINLILAN